MREIESLLSELVVQKIRPSHGKEHTSRAYVATPWATISPVEGSVTMSKQLVSFRASSKICTFAVPPVMMIGLGTFIVPSL